MSQPRDESLQYRHRGYKNSATGKIVEVFGIFDPPPSPPDGSTPGTLMEPLWDNWVDTKTTVAAYAGQGQPQPPTPLPVPPQPVPSPEAPPAV